MNLWNKKVILDTTQNCVNGIGTFQKEDAVHGRANVGSKCSYTDIHRVHHLQVSPTSLYIYMLINGINKN